MFFPSPASEQPLQVQAGRTNRIPLSFAFGCPQGCGMDWISFPTALLCTVILMCTAQSPWSCPDPPLTPAPAVCCSCRAICQSDCLGEHSAAPCQGEQLSSECQGCMQSAFSSSIQRVSSAPGLLTVQPEPSFPLSQAGQMELAAQGTLVPVTFMTDSFPPFLQMLPSYHI